MEDMINQMLDGYIPTPNWQIKKGTNNIELLVSSQDGASRAVAYTVLPGIHLFYFDIHARSLPGESETRTAGALQFNYCIGGRIELLLDDGTYIYLQENDFCISRQTSQNESCFPTKHYRGITLYFDPAFFDTAALETFEIDVSRLPEIYFCRKDTYIAEANTDMKSVLKKLWNLYDHPSSFYMKLYVAELLHLLLTEKDVCQAKPYAFYTGVRVEIAKKAEQILTADLRRHIPMRSLAEQFSVSETSLKNYFRGVYGENVSDYLRNLRMNTAAKLLIETKMPISEISTQVGYTKQGKFSAVFKQQFGMNPLEYRRINRLKKM